MCIGYLPPLILQMFFAAGGIFPTVIARLLIKYRRNPEGPKAKRNTPCPLYLVLKKITKNTQGSKVGRLRICQLWKFEWNRRESSQKKREKCGIKEKKINTAVTGNRTRDPSIIDQMSVLTNQVNLRIQFRHRFDQKCPFTDSLHRLEKTKKGGLTCKVPTTIPDVPTQLHTVSSTDCGSIQLLRIGLNFILSKLIGNNCLICVIVIQIITISHHFTSV